MAQERRETKLVVTRHGLVHNPEKILYYRAVDVPLSEDGHEQMRQVGRKIKEAGLEPVYIYTSTLTRAIQSAEAIAQSFPGIQILKEPDLQDPIAPGLELKTDDWLAEIEAEGHDVYSHPEFVKTIESKEAVAERMERVLKYVCADHAGETVIVLSHGDPIALLRARLRNPAAQLPSITQMKQDSAYPIKGEAWCVTFDITGKITREAIIS